MTQKNFVQRECELNDVMGCTVIEKAVFAKCHKLQAKNQRP